MKIKTGGSTGVSLTLYAAEEVSELRNACGRRHKRWTGWEVGEPMGAVWGNADFALRLRARIRAFLLSPTIYLDTIAVTPDAVRAFARAWRRTKPTLLFGHAHSIFVLAEMVREMKLREIRPSAIISSSMMLLPHERALIQDVFSVRVFDLYGCEEVGLIASECEYHEGMHVNVDQLLVELVREDGTPAPPGEPALVVVTDLLNRAMPLIRYRMEDMAERMDQPCRCGRGLPRIGRVVGRVADFLIRRDGTKIAGVSLIENSLTRIPGIVQLQIVQQQLERIVLRVVSDEAFTADRQTQLIDYFESTFPSAVITLETVDEIRPEPNGKYRFSICKVRS
jgi:phenylacetate-CoA ligase